MCSAARSAVIDGNWTLLLGSSDTNGVSMTWASQRQLPPPTGRTWHPAVQADE